MGMLGLRDFVVVAPAGSFHHQPDPIFPDHHHHHQSVPPPSSTALGIGVGVFPLLATAPPLATAAGDNSNNLRVNAAVGASNSESSSTACRDCGNKAKKDCKYRRCRTCCKNRGYDCSTHLKSTWVSAARRRERQMTLGGTAVDVGGGGSSGSSSGDAKRPRLLGSDQNTTTTTSHNSISNVNATAHRSFDSTSSQQDAGFKGTLPRQVRAQAVFRCVRVTAIEGGEDEFAYQAMVKIGGHVFKGFLYDQGVDEKSRHPCISELHLESSGCDRNRDASSSPILNQSNAYATPSNGMLGGKKISKRSNNCAPFLFFPPLMSIDAL
ncbi:protein LATERAL ROOT PRIMORDIUM 1 [Malania oleifera]|uniref:protein LATERAL ROOT PRIMORDIUM 1 n=1 Tax=Malania oleifera TaxID=397392 RepID=UPI0025ADF2A4|nr:protein LATERAL ROOT PRIMORDIUM 1 [Malania oleifera]